MYVCVYCASSNAITERYFTLARALGTELAQRGWTLVYGGGSVGLMGEVARAVHAAKGKVIGIIPQRLLDLEVGYLESDELIVTTTMRERKRLMDERADVFVTLPGGFGTLEELLEILTLKQLGYHSKPIVIVNLDGFYDPLLAQFARIFEEHFTHDRYRDLYRVVDDLEGALAVLGEIAQNA
ncbi:MAG TPA: TIGR00730 family Rossman fold protein [Roseiflexaceae bacterium]|nr:TIGR00730 family Rossman fold protein [Roseiflexaceae bacterium]